MYIMKNNLRSLHVCMCVCRYDLMVHYPYKHNMMNSGLHSLQHRVNIHCSFNIENSNTSKILLYTGSFTVTLHKGNGTTLQSRDI